MEKIKRAKGEMHTGWNVDRHLEWAGHHKRGGIQARHVALRKAM